MKLRAYLLGLVVALATLHQPVMAQPTDEATLLHLEQVWIDASKTRDFAAVDALIDDSYVADTPDGKQFKKDMLNFPAASPTQQLEGMSVKVDGDRASVSGTNTVTFPNGSRIKLSFVDNFARKNGQWRIVSSFVTK